MVLLSLSSLLDFDPASALSSEEFSTQTPAIKPQGLT